MFYLKILSLEGMMLKPKLQYFGHLMRRVHSLDNKDRDFPGGPVAKNLPSNAGDAGSIPGRGTKIPHAVEQLPLCDEGYAKILGMVR